MCLMRKKKRDDFEGKIIQKELDVDGDGLGPLLIIFPMCFGHIQIDSEAIRALDTATYLISLVFMLYLCYFESQVR